MISNKLLLEFGAKTHSYAKGEVIFKQNEHARFYHQVANGEVKMRNLTQSGKEFIQQIFSQNRSFGEPPLFGEFGYPADAVALTDCEIWQLPVRKFFELLKKHPEVHLKITSAIAERLYYKAIMAREISFEKPNHRILHLLQYLKNEVYQRKQKYTYEVELTRQQIADLTGLRVETTIKSIKELEARGEIKIIDRKIWI